MNRTQKRKQRKFVKNYFRKVHKKAILTARNIDEYTCAEKVKRFDDFFEEYLYDECPFLDDVYDYWGELTNCSCEKLAYENNFSKKEIKNFGFDCKITRLLNRKNKKYYRQIENVHTFKGRKNKRLYKKWVDDGSLPTRAELITMRKYEDYV